MPDNKNKQLLKDNKDIKNNPLLENLKILRNSIVNAVQRIKTPLIERGIDLEPANVGPSSVSKIVQRTWSTIWGKHGKGLSLLRLTEHGIPVIFPIDYQLEIINLSIGNSNSADYVEITWSDYADKVTLFTDEVPMEFWLSTDGTTFDKITISEEIGVQAGQHWHKAVLWGKTNKVRFKRLAVIALYNYYVISERVKPF